MALKIWDGFDHYSATADFLARSGFLQYAMPGVEQPTLTFVAGRVGGSAVQVYNPSLFLNSQLSAVWGDRNVEAFYGFALFISGGSVNLPSSFFHRLQDTVAAAPQLTIKFDGLNHAVQIWRGDYGGTSLFLSANNVWTSDVWNFVEVHAKIDGSAGELEVLINGVSVASVSGVNTQATANAWFDASDFIAHGASDVSGTGTIWLDDLYYCDTTTGPGTFPANTYLGDSRTVTLFANGEGTVQWTPLAGTNWSQIAETAMDSDASYNYAAAATDEDQIGFQALSASIPVIFGIELTIAVRKDDAGARVLKTGVKSGSTVSYGSNHSLSSGYAYFTDTWILDPATSANWTISGVNAVLGLYNLVS
jgi:hypothetical protein